MGLMMTMMRVGMEKEREMEMAMDCWQRVYRIMNQWERVGVLQMN